MATNNQQPANQDWVEVDSTTFTPVQSQPATTDADDGWAEIPSSAPNIPTPARSTNNNTGLPAFKEAEEPVAVPSPYAVPQEWTEVGAGDTGPQAKLVDTPQLGFFDRFIERMVDTPTQGFMGAIAAKYYDWTDYGHDILKKKFPNKSDAEIEILADRLISKTRKDILAEIDARQNSDPAWRPDESFISNMLSPERWVPAFTGTVLGSASPIDFFAPGGSTAARMGTAGLANAGEGAVTQGLDISSEVQDEFNFGQLGTDALFGSAFQGAIELPGMAYRDIMGPGQVRPDLADKVNAGKAESQQGGPEAGPTPKTDAEILRDFETESAIADMVEQGASAEEVMQAFPDYYAANPDAPAITQQWVDYKAGGGEERMRFRDDVNEAELFEQAFTQIMDEAGLPGVGGAPRSSPAVRRPDAEEGAPVPDLRGETKAPDEVELPPMTPRQQETYEGVQEITKDWKDTPRFEVVDSVDELPGPIRNAVYADGAETAPAFVGPDGVVRIISSNIPDRATLEAAVYHEMLGHKGLQNLFGEALDDMLNGLLVNAPQFRERVEAWIARETDPETGQVAYGGDRTRAAEEILAEMSEGGQITPSLMQKLRSVVEQFARRMGIKKTFSDNDIRMIVANAHRTVVNGEGGRGLPSQSIKGMRYMTGWHGTPHDFDRFLTEYIGTGEGAQAFGWGLYFASRKDIAEGYRDTLTTGKAGPKFKIGNKETQGTSGIINILTDEFYDRHPEATDAALWLDALGDYIRYKGRPPLVSQELIEHAERTYRLAATDFANASNAWVLEGLDSPERFRNIDLLLDMVDEIGVSKLGGGGKLYEVELPDDGVWLDLDKPIKDQAPEVKERLQAMGWEPDFITTKGKEWITEKLPRKYGSPKAVSQQLRMYGVTGNKYLDQGSRMRGEGTHNYVVFDESDVKVVNKYMRRSDRPEPGGATSSGGFGIPKPDSRMQARDRAMRRANAEENDPFESDQNKYIFGRRRPLRASEKRALRDAEKTTSTKATPKTKSRNERAGNLNLDRIQTGPDVKKYLKETADKFPTKRTTREEITDLAKELSMSPAEVKNLAKRMVKAEEVHAARMTVLKSAEEVEDMARRYVKGELNDREKAKFGMRAARHAAIQDALMDITGEAGRVLNIFNENIRTTDTGDISYMLRGMPNDMLRSPEFLDELASKVAKNPRKTNKIAREAFKPGASDYFWSAWYNFMLSRPTTHIANIAGTLMNTMLNLATYGGASIIGQTRRFNQARNIDLKTGYNLLERSEQIRSQARNRGVTPELNKSLKKQADEMRDRALRIIDANDRVSGREVAARVFGAIAGIKAGFVNAPKAFVLGVPLHRVSRVEHQTAIMPGALTVIETPVRFMAATDEFFRNIIQASDYYGQAMRRAVGEGRKGRDMVDRVTQLVDRPTEEMLTSASNYAQVLQFLDDPSGVGRKIEQLRTKKPSDNLPIKVARGTLRAFVPFIRSPDSLIRTAVRYSPFGAFGTDRYNVADAAAGGGRKDLARTRVAMGTALALYVAWMVENEMISGEGPKDFRKREELESTGWAPNSIKVGNEWISYQGFEPVSIPLNVVATTAERAIEADMKSSEKGGQPASDIQKNTENAFAGILGLSEALTNNTWTSSLHDLITLAAGGGQGGGSTATNAVASLAGTAVPAVVRGYNQDIADPTRRITTGSGSLEDRVVGRLQSSIPGQSEQLPVARDVFGRPIEREGSPEIPFIGQEVSNFVNRSKKSTISDDPVDVELDRLTKQQSGTVIGMPSRSNIKTWEGERDLNAEEYSEYVRIAGQNLFYWMSEFIQTPEYQNMTDDEKVKAIQKERNRVRKLTREMLFGTADTPPKDLSEDEWEEVEP